MQKSQTKQNEKILLYCVLIYDFMSIKVVFIGGFASGQCWASFAVLYVLMIEHKLGGGKTSAKAGE